MTTYRWRKKPVIVVLCLALIVWVWSRWKEWSTTFHKEILEITQSQKDIAGSRKWLSDESLNRLFSGNTIMITQSSNEPLSTIYSWVSSSDPLVSQYSSREALYIRIGTGDDLSSIYKILQLDTWHLTVVRVSDEFIIPLIKNN